MANAIVQPYLQGTQAAATAPLVDPRHPREERIRYRRSALPELSRANSFYCPGGMWPSRGWVLVKRGDYNNLNLYATNLQLQINDFVNGNQTFQNLAIVQAQCVTRGIAADPAAVFLVELADARHLVWNRWWQQPTTSQYNVRAPAYDGQYYSASLNSGAAWTWDGMLGNLWGQMTQLGTYPGLPITPAGTPENFIFPGTSCWQAVCRILVLLGCVVAVNPTSAAPYSIVQVGNADAAFAALQAKYLPALEDDLEWIDTGAGRVPLKVTVFFHVRYQYYGTEETVRNDSFQWSSTPLYSVTVTGTYPNAVSTAYLWDDFTVRLDTNGSPLAADVATAATIAAERVTQFYDRIERGTSGYLHQTYTGALPFVTGSLVDGVCWRQDFREAGRSGWRTEVLRGTIWPEATDMAEDIPDAPPFQTL